MPGNLVTIEGLMERSGVAFGTSGARGLVRDMTDKICFAYTAGFVQYLESIKELPKGDKRIAIGGDLRPSTDRIMQAAAAAILERGYQPVNCGKIPSPALALYGLNQHIPTIMVTGSHIPDDRNGIKFTMARGEILKNDEEGIRAQTIEIPKIFDQDGMLINPTKIDQVDNTANEIYLKRWLDTFPTNFLAGKRIGIYEHSAVGRDLLYEIITQLGAEVTSLGRSETFIPVDTEAIRPEDIELAATWAQEYNFDAILSADGDSDRPLIADENGKWLRGDVAGVLCARFLNADAVVTPVSCNTALELSGWFKETRRTRIGSPYVIAELDNAISDGFNRVVGYEANGGFLTAAPISVGGKILAPLPTRDAVIVHLAILGLSIKEGKPISELVKKLPKRFTASDRLKNFPTEISRQRIGELQSGGPEAIEQFLGKLKLGKVSSTNTTDGLRITFQSGNILHLRPSGNAPELRCYVETDSEEGALALAHSVIEQLDTWRV